MAHSTPLNTFIPNDYGVPYGYSSVFFAPKHPSAQQESLYRRFLRATGRAYREIARDPRAIAQALTGAIDHPNYQDSTLLEASIKNLASSLLREKNWGHQEAQVYTDYLEWIQQQDFSSGEEAVQAEVLFSNAFLPESSR